MTTNAMTVEGRAGVVTGAAMGIGEGIAEVLSERGARLVLVDREAEVEQVAARLGASHVVGDVRDPATAERAVQACQSAYGVCDLLVNNAGALRTALLHELTDDDWDTVIGVNLTGAFLMMRAAVPAMLAAGGGAIDNVASISSFITLPEHAAYCASKGGLLQLTRQAALEYAASGIRVNAVAPGTVDTPLVRRFLEQSSNADQVLADLYAGHPIGRIGTAREVGTAVAFLASDDASFITGVNLPVDGGTSASNGEPAPLGY